MKITVGDFILQRLSDWGVRRVFGYPGDGINGIMGAMGRATKRFDYVRVRHEEMSAFMACGHAKFTGDTGVCLATSGPGALHLLAGLYDAKMDHVPVVAIVGQQATSALGSDYQQEVNLAAVFQDVSSYTQTITSPAQVRHVIDRAFRIAAAERAVACIIVPNDVQLMEAVPSAPRSHGNTYSSVGAASFHPVPTLEDLQRAAAVLNAGRRVAVLAGAGALQATDELIRICDRLGAGLAKAMLGKACVPDDLPFVTGAIGLLGTEPSWWMMEHCDTLLMVGTTFPYTEFLPEEGQAQAVQIDLSPRNVGIRYPTAVNLVGDARDTLSRLIPMLNVQADSSWRAKIEERVAEWRKKSEALADVPASPINPQKVFRELSARLPEATILCDDSGSHTGWYARDVQLRRGMMGSLSGKLASMGCAVPYAIAAKMAHPDRPVVAIVGDGAMQMNGNAELVTVQQYWSRWRDPRFVVMVLVNHDLNMVTWEQRALAGDPKYAAAQDVIDFPYARYGEMLGFKGIHVEDPARIGAAWDEAFAADRPVVIAFVTDPNVPPIPPHVPWEQVKKLLGSLGQDPDKAGIVKQAIRQVLAGLKADA